MKVIKKFLIATLISLSTLTAIGQNRYGNKTVIELTNQIGCDTSSIDNVKMSIATMYSDNKNLSFGVGLGIQHFPTMNTTLIPVFFRTKLSDTNKAVSPFIKCDIGASFINPMSEIYKNSGLMVSTAVGIVFKMANDIKTDLSISYETHEMGVNDMNTSNNKSIGTNISLTF